MVGVRAVTARKPQAFPQSESMFDTDLRSVGIIRDSGRKRASVTEAQSPYYLFEQLRLHFGIRKMGVKVQGDIVAALLATNLRKMDSETRQSIYAKLGFAGCSVYRTQSSCPTYVLIHGGGTGLLTEEGYLRPAKPLIWAQQFRLSQLVSESLIGWAINGMNRNEDLQQLTFKKGTTQAVYLPATNQLVDWWLRSEGSNTWQYNGDNLQWSGALALAMILCDLEMNSELDEEFKTELKRVFENAVAEATITATGVANDIAELLESISQNIP